MNTLIKHAGAWLALSLFQTGCLTDVPPPPALLDAQPIVDLGRDSYTTSDGGSYRDARIRDAAISPDARQILTRDAFELSDGPRIVDIGPGCVSTTEICNEHDDDCDGLIDNVEGQGGVCFLGESQCRREGRWACLSGQTNLQCDAPPIQAVETCNGIDDDCDGDTDEDIDSSGCQAQNDGCTGPGLSRCIDGEVSCIPIQELHPQNEACNDQDDDCDGSIDEGDTCLNYVVHSCAAYLAQSDNNQINNRIVADWGDCPASPLDNAGDLRCVSSGTDEDFHNFDVSGLVDGNDALGIAFRCDGDQPVVDEWVQSHCEVYLGYADFFQRDALNNLPPLDCPVVGDEDALRDPRCVRSGGDGFFHSMWLGALLVSNADHFGIAFRCSDPDTPDRAARLQERLAITITWNFSGIRAGQCADRVPVGYGDCPRRGSDNSGYWRCASSSGDGVFHTFGFNFPSLVTLQSCSSLGIAFRRLPD